MQTPDTAPTPAEIAAAREWAANSDLRMARKTGEIMIAQTSRGTLFLTHAGGVYTLSAVGGAILTTGRPAAVRPVLASLYVVEGEETAAAPAPRYKVVTETDGRFRAETLTRAELDARFDTSRPTRRASLRAELQGEPSIPSLVGPMWDGLDEAGAPIIRYETREAYRLAST